MGSWTMRFRAGTVNCCASSEGQPPAVMAEVGTLVYLRVAVVVVQIVVLAALRLLSLHFAA